jgi:hypothetical protein
MFLLTFESESVAHKFRSPVILGGFGNIQALAYVLMIRMGHCDAFRGALNTWALKITK